MFAYLRWVARAFKYRRSFERCEVRFLLRHLHTGEVAVDIGAYKGAFLYWMLQGVGSSGKVVAFEPQPTLTDNLRRLTRRRPNVRIEGAAVSSSEGKAHLYVPESRGRKVSPLSSLAKPAGPNARIDVPLLTLDRYFADHRQFRPVSFIKCDVEQHEWEVFLGGQRLLREDHPVVLLECAPGDEDVGQERWRGLLGLFERLGYSGWFFDRATERPVEATTHVDLARYLHNMAFTPKGLHP